MSDIYRFSGANPGEELVSEAYNRLRPHWSVPYEDLYLETEAWKDSHHYFRANPIPPSQIDPCILRQCSFMVSKCKEFSEEFHGFGER